MPTKAQIYAQKADETARQITGDYLDWASFSPQLPGCTSIPFRSAPDLRTATKRHRLRQL